ncbi:hypothetical protein FisN_10Lh262 [Fistulifera solaris]|uniref:R3H domain-containing protein n=1 Tax=Fistulifera solaris TaxID=1519565 RepID=A0A1Z5KFT3_FISSO|nr:hypothetical protein FisN_10Lh262 [Fistulifera solaris]|eukprot:GAX25066.1 hypothetical protein FisN_10Lh262 [Fistulifera solaris]
MDLTPSQVIRTNPKKQGGDRAQESLATTTNNRDAGNNPHSSGAPKKRRRGKHKQQQQAGACNETPVNTNDASSPPKVNANQPSKTQSRNRSKRNTSKKTDQKIESSSEGNIVTEEGVSQPKETEPRNPIQKNGDSNKKKRNRKRNAADKQYPWKSKVPEDAVDPITLDHIRDLKYPPFALVANEPYLPVEEWPVPDVSPVPDTPHETEEERQRRILAEQWGEQHGIVDADLKNDDTAEILDLRGRHVNLYDGRALAYYMVSQLQFIDPLNRRDLTRDEINNLDRYLRRHGFYNMNVTEAYDAKGITLSTAGAAANTATGRAAILQQEARNLLNAMFGNSTVNQSNRAANNSNTLMQQYLAHEAASTEQYNRRRQRNNTTGSRQSPTDDHENGIYGGTGFMVIDDELNPGLRTEAHPDIAASQQVGSSNTLWSSSHITQQHGSGAVPRAWEFPSLSTVVQQLPKPAEPASRSTQRPAEKKPPSKTLANIGSAVRKTDPEELQRQFEAREEAIRRAMMSNLTFGSNPSAIGVGIAKEIPKEISATSEGPSIEQLNRNRAFAEALGVVPSTVRGFSGSLNSGWARPSEGLQLDEYGNELNTTVYPDSLILQARDKMTVLVKLEKRWKTFLADDTSASLPLNKMDRPTRAMVHEYAAFWNLRTESFDPEPRRYIHCSKLQETRAPFPLLSAAARAWRGPTFNATRADHPLQQTAEQNTGSQFIPVVSERMPIPLKPRSETVHSENIDSLSTQEDGKEGSRFLASGRERPKLELQERTLPLDRPLQIEEYDIKKDLANQRRRAEEKRQRELEQAQRKQRLLEAAFASDDEQSVGRVDDDSDWEEQAPLYTGDEEN